MRKLVVTLLFLAVNQGVFPAGSAEKLNSCRLTLIRQDIIGLKEAIELESRDIQVAEGDEIALALEPAADVYAYLSLVASDGRRIVIYPGTDQAVDKQTTNATSYRIPAGYYRHSRFFPLTGAVRYKQLDIVLSAEPLAEWEQNFKQVMDICVSQRKALVSELALPDTLAGTIREDAPEPVTVKFPVKYEKTYYFAYQ